MKLTLLKNFESMPLLLKLLTAVAFILPFCILLATSSSSIVINAFGTRLSGDKYWGTGTGVVVLVLIGVLFVSSLMMLSRKRGARLAHVGSWALMTFSLPIFTHLLGMKFEVARPALVSNLIATCIIALYLYASPRVRTYFGKTGVGMSRP